MAVMRTASWQTFILTSQNKIGCNFYLLFLIDLNKELLNNKHFGGVLSLKPLVNNKQNVFLENKWFVFYTCEVIHI